MEQKQKRFQLANDLDFYDACCNFVDRYITEKTNDPLKTVGLRMGLIEELEKNGFVITKGEKPANDDVILTIDPKATIEIINHDAENSWVRWYFPDFSDNGNIDLPSGKNYRLKTRIGNKVTIEKI